MILESAECAAMNRVLQPRFLLSFKAPLAYAVSSSALTSRRPLSSNGSPPCWIFKMPQDHIKVSSIRRFIYGFKFCSATQDLKMKKCVPCESKDIRPMSEQSATELLQQVRGWDMANEGGIMKLHKSWKVKSFTKGLEFFQLVANIAEAEGHHPDLHLVGWNNVKIEIWTHSVGGLTENDFILAAKIDALDVEQLLKKKKVAP